MMASILICCDSFKGTLSSKEVNDIIETRLYKHGYPTHSFEFSDGGEGLLESLKPILKNHESLKLKTVNHLHQEIEAEVLIKDDMAYLESANVVGLNMIPLNDRNILNLDTKGLGLLVKQLYEEKGIKKFAVGLGGSGTSDYGIGFVQGLGYEFFDKHNEIIKQPLKHLEKITRVETENEYNDVSFLFISDVISPAVGDLGAAKIFGPQKNATPEEVDLINEGGKKYIKILSEYNNEITETTPYLGAAGGIALSLSAFFECEFIKGAEFILNENHFNDLKHEYDYIVTGEGKFDFQSLQGKIVGEILNQVKTDNQIIVFTGKIDLTEEENKSIQELKNFHLYECTSVKGDPEDFLIKENAIANLDNQVSKFIAFLDRKEK